MSKKILLTMVFAVLGFIFPGKTFAADLDIYCYENQKPLVVQNTSPLFSLSGFNPGAYEKRSIYLKNYDPVNNCNLYFDAVGTKNLLTDILQLNISEIFSGSLSRFIQSDNILVGSLKPGQEIVREVEISFPSTSENNYQDKQASFELIITSQWGGDEVNEENVLGEQTVTNINDNSSEVLGANNNCNKKSYWWLLLVQFALTLFVIFFNKWNFKGMSFKLLITSILGIIVYFLMNYLGCGCNPNIICTYHWVANLLIAISPSVRYLLKK